jgi:hypothetical protein
MSSAGYTAPVPRMQTDAEADGKKPPAGAEDTEVPLEEQSVPPPPKQMERSMPAGAEDTEVPLEEQSVLALGEVALQLLQSQRQKRRKIETIVVSSSEEEGDTVVADSLAYACTFRDTLRD